MDAVPSYLRINDALNLVFFDGRFAGHPVYLSLDNAMREEFAGLLGRDAKHVEDIVCKCVGHWLNHEGDPYFRSLAELRNWRRSGMQSPPPFTAVLFCLSHAAAIMAAEDGFASNNYYRRLEQVTGVKRQLLSTYGKSTDGLWSALNGWLLENNFELGRPTARAVNSWTYVSKAISQAVVRAGDRELFHDLFEKYHFSGNESISLREMMHYLSNWMHSSRSNARLKNAWKDAVLQERVAEAAIAELSLWGSRSGGRAPGIEGSKARKLSLLLNFVPKFPSAILELHVGRMGDDIQQGPFDLRGSEAEFFLANERFGNFATISPSPFGATGEGLGQHFEFKLLDISEELEWEPRLIIPFTKSPYSALWVEVARVAFGIPHFVLVRDANNLPKTVESYLGGVAIQMYEKAIHGELRGIPAGWVLYKDVQVRLPSEHPRKDLECLVPLGGEGLLSIVSGLQLLPDFYHAKAGLVAKFVASEGPTRIEAVAAGSGEVLASSASELSDCVAELETYCLRGQNAATIRAFRGEECLETIEIFFRDANKPTPLFRDLRGRLAYKSVLSAAPSNGLDGLMVEGTIIHGDLPRPIPQVAIGNGRLPSGANESVQDATLAKTLSIHVSCQTCVERGFHYWKCETLKPGMPSSTPLEQQCKDCRLSLIVIHRGRKDVNTTPAHIVKVAPLRTEAPSSAAIDHELLLDALCFLGGGSWGKFQSLLGENNGEAYFPRQVAQNYFLLGFLDLELRAGTNSIKSWCVPPPSLNFISKSQSFLSGFRCQDLLDSIINGVSAAGGSTSQENLDCRPPLIMIDGLDAVAAKEALGEVRDPLGRALAIVEEAGSQLVNACFGLEGFRSNLIPTSIGRPRNLQKYDVATARWVEASIVVAGEAYRWNDGLQTYAFVGSDRSALQGPHEVVKLLAARRVGIHLHSQDIGESKFLSTLGCEPPGMLGRALVAFSGRLPAVNHGIVSYQEVPNAAACDVLHLLYDEGF